MLDSLSVELNQGTEYPFFVTRGQRLIRAGITDNGQFPPEYVEFTYCFTSDPGTGQSGLYADKTDVKFDDVTVYPGGVRNPLTRRIVGVAKVSISSAALLVEGGDP